MTCEIVGCEILPLILFLAHLIDLEMASKFSKTWILHVLRFNQLFHEWNNVLPRSWLILMIKKLFNNTKTYQKLISVLEKVLNVPIGLKCIN